MPTDAGDAADAITRARRAITQVHHLTDRLDAAREARDEAIREALRLGLSLGEVSRQLQLSKSLVRLAALPDRYRQNSSAEPQGGPAGDVS